MHGGKHGQNAPIRFILGHQTALWSCFRTLYTLYEIMIISILFRTLCMSDLDFTKESLLNPCIWQIQGFSKDSLVKSTFEIHNVRK